MTSDVHTDDQRVLSRAGLTLVELLVVVTILVILVSVTIPLMRSIRNGSQLEAAVRKIESVMHTAKARAITNGRPAGIVFVRDKLTPSVAYEVALAESPPPYGGEGMGAGLEIAFTVFPPVENPVGSGLLRAQFRFATDGSLRPLRTLDDNDTSNWFIQPGDEVRFGLKGKRYKIQTLTNPYTVLLEDTTTPLGFFSGRMAVQFYRSPRRTMAAPIELPQGAYVKLTNSGIALDRGGAALDQRRRLFSEGDVVLAFNPSGKVDRLYRGSPTDVDDSTFGFSVPVNGTLRIDLGDASPAAPANAQRFLVRNRADRNSKPIAPTALIPPLEGS